MSIFSLQLCPNQSSNYINLLQIMARQVFWTCNCVSCRVKNSLFFNSFFLSCCCCCRSWFNWCNLAFQVSCFGYLFVSSIIDEFWRALDIFLFLLIVSLAGHALLITLSNKYLPFINSLLQIILSIDFINSIWRQSNFYFQV